MPRTTRVCGLTLLDAVPRPVTMARMNRILIVDDNAGFRVQARALLEADGSDLVLLDIGLPDVEGFEVARSLADDGQPPYVVLTSSREATEYGPRLTTSRALGFLPKDELSGPAIRALADAV